MQMKMFCRLHHHHEIIIWTSVEWLSDYVKWQIIITYWVACTKKYIRLWRRILSYNGYFATQETLITRKQITRVPRIWNWSQILQPYVSFSSSQIHSFATVIIDRLLIVHDLCIFFMLLLSSIQHQTETLREMNKITPYGVCSLSNYKTTFEMMMRNCHEVCE